MISNNYKGKFTPHHFLKEKSIPPKKPTKSGAGFIVFEGIDGSGKATQVNLLQERLKSEGFKVEKIDFPQHGESSSYFVDAYLNGKYGAAEEVGPFRGSVFYTLDRYDASFDIKNWLKEGKIIIADRYVASNIGHQGGKIKGENGVSHLFYLGISVLIIGALLIIQYKKYS